MHGEDCTCVPLGVGEWVMVSSRSEERVDDTLERQEPCNTFEVEDGSDPIACRHALLCPASTSSNRDK